MAKDFSGLNETRVQVDAKPLPKVDFVGVTAEMPGTNGAFTVAAFDGSEVPPGTRLYKAQPAKVDGVWNQGTPVVANLSFECYIVAVHRCGIPGIPYRFAAYYFNNYCFDNEGPQTGWFACNLRGRYVPLLNEGDVLRGWMELPEWKEQ